MDRRRFTRLGSLALAGSWLRGPSGRPLAQQTLEADRGRLERRMRRLATFGANAAGGIDRVAFSDANIEALEWVGELLADAGFSPGIDLAGNLIAGKPGSDAALPPIMFGSHIDSVPGGGNYDGQVGSMGAVEVAATLADSGHTTRHPLEIAIFCNEEGGKTGSRALVGEVEAFELELKTASGYTIGEGLARLGGDPNRLVEARRAPGSLKAFIELHVEQGAVLDEDDIDIGVVEGIVGIMRWNVTVTGMTNHAGTTPMGRRRDAMVGAARFIQTVQRIAGELPGRQVATVGRLVAQPGAPNVIPGRVDLTLEIRDLSMEGIERVYEAIVGASRVEEVETGTTIALERFYTSRAAPTDRRLRDLVERNAARLGLSSLRMPSGAGHDAQSMALICPVGMIFVPSVGGISHAPEERTELPDVVNGTNVLLGTLLELDGRDL
jgi:N-carbamoyl-L-amino-acid hydrolase